MTIELEQLREHLERLRVNPPVADYVERYKLLNGTRKRGFLPLQLLGSSQEEFKQFMAVSHKMEAKELLEKLLASTSCDDYEKLYRRMLNVMGNGKVSLQDMGVTEKKLKRLKVKVWREECGKQWEKIKQDPSNLQDKLNALSQKLWRAHLPFSAIGIEESDVCALRKQMLQNKLRPLAEQFRRAVDFQGGRLMHLNGVVATHGLTLADIGISAKDIVEYKSRSAKAGVAGMLTALRRGNSRYARWICYIRQYLVDKNLSLADIGSSEEELASLKLKGHKTAVQKWLHCIRDGYNYRLCCKLIVRELKAGRLQLSDFGTSWQEVKCFQKA